MSTATATPRTDSKGTTMAVNEPLRKQISELLATHRVVLFMKGNRRMPQCGFSGECVQILDKLLPSYETVDVLRSCTMPRASVDSLPRASLASGMPNRITPPNPSRWTSSISADSWSGEI